MYSKLYILILIVSEICLSVSQEPGTEIPPNIEDNITLEKLHRLVEDNRLLTWNLLKNSLNLLKDGLTAKIDASAESLKMDLFSELKMELAKNKMELSSEINKINIEVNDVKLKVDKMSENILISEQLKTESDINKNNLVNESKLVNNDTINACVDNGNEIIRSLIEFKSENKIITQNLNTKIDNEIKVAINEVTEKVKDMNMNMGIKINELKQFKERREVDNTNIIMTQLKELKEINRNANSVCDNNKNAFKDLIIKFAAPAKNCAELLHRGDNISGIRMVGGVDVVCDQDTDGGGWTVFQRRDDLPIRENFYRTWADYSKGFGNLTGEFWLGLDNIHRMTKYTSMELRVDLEDVKGEKKFIRYEMFSIESANEKYRLNLGKTYIGIEWGNEGINSLGHSNQMKFSTRDQDNDIWRSGSCAKEEKGAWWYKKCGHVNLNGFQFVGRYSDEPSFVAHGIRWESFGGRYNSLKRTKLMFRPRK